MSEGSYTPRKVADLREGEENLDVKVRVLSVEPPKVIHTQRGDRTISEAVVGDETGRVKLTAWGSQAGKLQEGEAVELKGAWTTSFRGQVQLNIGGRGKIEKIDDSEVPKPEEVPDVTPKASSQPAYRSRQGRFGGGRRGGRRSRRERPGAEGSFGEESEESEESEGSSDEF